MNQKLRLLLTHVGAVLLFLVIAAVYFEPQLSGKVIQQGDVIQYRGMAKELDNYYEKTGVLALWTNSMFGGMPSYQINTIKDGNFLTIVDDATRLFIDEPIGRFFAAMVCFYILMVALGASPLLSIAAAIAFGLTTNNMILFEAGHNTKVRAISFLPLIAAGMLLAYRGRYLWGGTLFALGVGVNVMSNHVQMSYYFFLTMIIMGLAQLVYDLRRGEMVSFLKGTAVLLLGGLLGLGSSASNLLPTYEYSRDTMRGAPILKPEGNAAPASSSETEGLAWDYAMQWSNGTIDLFASFIPGVAGGGSQETVGQESAIAADLRSKGARLPAEIPAPLYWGKLPFTSGPIYFGAVVFLLAVLGVFWVSGPVRWWLAGGALLTFMLSMGSNLAWFNRFVFEYFPLYNKFRTPNSVLSITAFLLPLLGFWGLWQLIKAEGQPAWQSMMRGLYIGVGALLAMSLFFVVMGPSFFDFNTDGDARYVEAGYDLGAIIADRQAFMRADAFRSFLLIALSGGLIWAYMRKMIGSSVMLSGLLLLTVYDLWSVDKRYVNEDNFVTPTNYKDNFTARPVDEEILRDKDPSYRVMDLTVNTFNSSMPSYYHKSVGGYHAAKLQRYQDMIDRHFSKGNQRSLDMLNTRYFITGTAEEPKLQRNPNALGNGWFVDSIYWAKSPNEEIDALNSIDPARVAVVHEPEFKDYLKGFEAKDAAGSIALTDYAPDKLTYTVEASAAQLAVFSEIWYGPDKGWQAYIDGKPVDHIRVNYILRAMKVPAGKHTIVFEFDPASYKTGLMVSTICSSAILLALLGLIGMKGYQFATSPVVEEAVDKKPVAKASVKKTGKK
jgi:Bacterial membrane protein YfhO